jgi:hypothetical protein
MARVVETVAADLGDRLRWEKVITKDLRGALRYGEICKHQGKPIPVPSILVDGELAFVTTPGPEELKQFLQDYLKNG